MIIFTKPIAYNYYYVKFFIIKSSDRLPDIPLLQILFLKVVILTRSVIPVNVFVTIIIININY